MQARSSTGAPNSGSGAPPSRARDDEAPRVEAEGPPARGMEPSETAGGLEEQDGVAPVAALETARQSGGERRGRRGVDVPTAGGFMHPVRR